MGRHHCTLPGSVPFSKTSVYVTGTEHPGARRPSSVLLDKKGVILEGLAFLGLLCWGCGADAVLFAGR